MSHVIVVGLGKGGLSSKSICRLCNKFPVSRSNEICPACRDVLNIMEKMQKGIEHTLEVPFSNNKKLERVDPSWDTDDIVQPKPTTLRVMLLASCHRCKKRLDHEAESGHAYLCGNCALKS